MAAPDRRVYLRRLAIFFAVTTAVNIVIGTQGTYRAVQHMETPQFCGQTCHVMQPYFAAHSELGPRECRMRGLPRVPGATGYLKAKMGGTRQFIDVVFNRVHLPIESAIASNRLVPSRLTCEQCHWRQEFEAVKFQVIFHFQDDATNTQTQTALMMLTGGGDVGGIHGKHLGPGVEIDYAATDPARQTIPWVRYMNTSTKEVRTFLADGSTAQSVASLPRHQMQCVDCHNSADHALSFQSVPWTEPWGWDRSLRRCPL